MFTNFFQRFALIGFIAQAFLPVSAEEIGEPIQAFFEKNCVRCHGPEKEKGDIRLDQLPATIEDEYSAETWQEVLDVLNGADMPPEDEPQPSNEDLAEAIAAITDKLFEARKRLVDPKSVTIRRLNKREYANTIHDLLGVPVDTSNLPADGTLDGFDTIGDAHFMSVPQFEAYLKLARSALDQSLENGPRPEMQIARIEPEKSNNKRAEDSLARLKPEIARHETVLADPNSTEDEKKHAETRLRKENDTLLRSQGYLKQPASETGFILDITQAPFGGQAHDKVSVARPRSTSGRSDADTEPRRASLGDPIGRYVVRFRAGLTCKPRNGERLVAEVTRSDTFNMQVSYRHSLGIFEITKPMDDPHVFEVEFENLGELDDRIAVRVDKLNEAQYRTKTGRRSNFVFPDSTQTPYVWVDWLEVKGPIIDEWPPPAWQTTFFKGDTVDASEEANYAREVISRFAARAFRGREPSEKFLDQIHGIYADHRGSGNSFVNSVKEALAVVLASPSFVYLVEPTEEEEEKRQLTDSELASRLSYFLWSHPPDAELLQLAKANELSEPGILSAQVERLLRDPKSDHFTKAFMSQWLELDWLDMIVVNTNKFPNFNEQLRLSMREEPVEMFREMLREDLSVTHFIDSDFVFIDGMLSRFYGIDRSGDQAGFQKVKLPADSPRGGLIGTGAILTMTGTGERTSPVERGVFVYHRMLGKDISPPPPNVPQLVVEDGAELTVRQLLEAHTSQAQCASCHRRMDPLGFGLERFDAIGEWRKGEAQVNQRGRTKRRDNDVNPIDATGVMPDRLRKFDGHEELKAYLLEDQDEMATGFLKSILTYALGRRVGFSDGQFVEDTQTDWKNEDYAIRKLIHLIVQSEPFQTK